MVTMKDVAQLAGVSITTVSHVVNGTRAVAAETKERVLDAVAKTGYTGDVIARSLVTGGTRSLGVAISLVANPYFAELMQAIESEATAAGYTLLLVDTHDEAETEEYSIRMLRARRVDGLLLTPSPGAVSTVLPELRRLNIPTVLVDRLPGNQPIDQVGPENVQAMSALVQHLGELGHRRIGMISGAAGLTTSSERELGYRLGLGRAGLPWDPDLVASGESTTMQGGVALAQLLSLAAPPTAVVAGNNAMMVGVLHEARRRQLKIGTDLAVVGYDDVEWAELVDPPLTTMAQPIADIGRTAVRMLLARIQDPSREPQTVRLPAKLMHRQSCGCA
jgi:LacI family transcriptional regulator